jgi:hypothetical protein
VLHGKAAGLASLVQELLHGPVATLARVARSVLREIIARRAASGVWRQGDDERGVVAGLAFAGGGLALVPVDGDGGAAGRDGGGGQGQVGAQAPPALERACR